VSPKIEHIVFVVSYLEIRRMTVMMPFKNGWNTFHKKERLRIHVGDVGGAHYVAMKKFDDLLQRNQHIDVAFHSVSKSSKKNYLTRLNVSIDVARILLKQGLSFRAMMSQRSP
jgi:hypothetical protein